MKDINGGKFDLEFIKLLNENFKEQKGRVDNLIWAKPVAGEVEDLRVDNRGTIHDIARDRFTADAEYLAAALTNLSISQINKNLGKIDQTYLTEELLQQIAGTADINAVPADGSITTPKMANKAITAEKLKNVINLKRTNLFNPDEVEKGGFYDYQTGLWVNSANYASTPPIEIEGGVEYGSNVKRYIAFYDVDGNFITGYTGWTSPITTPENARIFRGTMLQTEIPTYMFTKGKTPAVYVGYDDVTFNLSGLKLKGKDIEDLLVNINNMDFVDLIPGKNLANPNEFVYGMAAHWSTGELRDYSSSFLNSTGFIPVEPGKTYTRNYRHAICFYDQQQNYVIGYSTGDEVNNATNDFTVPEGCYFVRLPIHDSYLDKYQVEEGAETTAFEPFGPKYKFDYPVDISNAEIVNATENFWKGKNIVYTGDSITANSGASYYPSIVASNLGATFDNYAISGSTFAVNPNNPSSRTPLATRFMDMTDNADLVIVACSTNDWQYDWTSLGDNESRDIHTFYGALHTVCLGLIKKYPGKPILFMTPIKRAQSPYTTPDAKNANGKTLREYGEILKDVCTQYSIPVLDMYAESGIYPFDPELRDMFVPDNTHPNAAGHALMARRLTGYLKQFA
jgi:lysophospholipase L1-like esterase